MQPVIMNAEGMARTLRRLSHEIEERNEGFSGVVLVGVKRGGEVVARRLSAIISETGRGDVPCAGLDITMSRDDLVSAFILPEAEKNDLGFPLEGKTVVLCDDVLHTGRSAVAGIEALFRLGRPAKIQLLVLVDRGGRELPVRADYVGKNVPTSKEEYIEVHFTELGAGEDALTITRRTNAEA
ncbi:MAG TPA: bifunctional pyr operon transcriptional regulator/uracil phosphoribosyltransferase PyrR [Firmicutes bacterium]|nr:bifunctional pyr operon transcriptional regulator/uracil phosphoribosyltransferase PyrR [Bacillota bacterium]